MMRFAVGAFAVLLLAAAAAARGQEPTPARVDASRLADGEPVDLSWAWRSQPGDDVRWASPTWDDSRWKSAETLHAPGKLPAGGWRGSVWFRRHLRLIGEPPSLVVRLQPATRGAADVYLDGRLLAATAGAAGSGAILTSAAVTLEAARPHVLAVRWVSSLQDAARPGPYGFRVTLVPSDAAARRSRTALRSAALGAAFLAIPAFLVLLHLALYRAYPRARENLYYAASMVCFGGDVLCDLFLTRSDSGPLRDLADRASGGFTLGLILFVLLTYLSVRLPALPKSTVGFAIAGVGLAILSWLVPSAAQWSWWLFFLAMTIEVVRLELSTPARGRDRGAALRVGAILLGLAAVVQILVNAGIVAPPGGFGGIYIIGMLAFAVSMSLFLAADFARTNRDLERRLLEVRELSTQVLAQERLAHEHELQHRLLEAEDARKSGELAAARRFQLALLPASAPDVEGLEVAAAMTTATEVGGDYYDFERAADGSLVIACGDATGHGVAAGTMVTAVKAIFSVLGVARDLAGTLAECDRALRGLNVGRLHMCLAIARITPVEVTLVSAGMPPVLLYRAASGAVEELAAGGLPLGTRLRPQRQASAARLAPGDTLLFASDGLGELLDRDDVALGFDGAADAFGAAAGVEAAAVLRRLQETVVDRRAGDPPGDDVTMVVVRVRP